MSPVFRDRRDAARRLVERLKHYRLGRAIVLGIRCGAVPMAKEIADALGTEFDLFLAHQVKHPGDPELVLAAVDETGHVARCDAGDLSDAELERLAAPEVQRFRDQRRAMAGSREPSELRDRLVILVDEGLATGATMLSAVRLTRGRGANRVIAASPVASQDAIERLRPEVDELVILTVPRALGDVGRWYRDFRPVSYEDVLAALEPHAEQL